MGVNLKEVYLEQKLDLVERLFQITQKIWDMVSAGQLDELTEFMDNRERTIFEIDNLDRVYKDKCNLHKGLSANLDAKVQKMKKYLLDTQKLDSDLMQKIQNLMVERTKEFKKVKQVRKVQNAYNSGVNSGNFIDRQR